MVIRQRQRPMELIPAACVSAVSVRRLARHHMYRADVQCRVSPRQTRNGGRTKEFEGVIASGESMGSVLVFHAWLCRTFIHWGRNLLLRFRNRTLQHRVRPKAGPTVKPCIDCLSGQKSRLKPSASHSAVTTPHLKNVGKDESGRQDLPQRAPSTGTAQRVF